MPSACKPVSGAEPGHSASQDDDVWHLKADILPALTSRAGLVNASYRSICARVRRRRSSPAWNARYHSTIQSRAWFKGRTGCQSRHDLALDASNREVVGLRRVQCLASFLHDARAAPRPAPTRPQSMKRVSRPLRPDRSSRLRQTGRHLPRVARRA